MQSYYIDLLLKDDLQINWSLNVQLFHKDLLLKGDMQVKPIVSPPHTPFLCLVLCREKFELLGREGKCYFIPRRAFPNIV